MKIEAGGPINFNSPFKEVQLTEKTIPTFAHWLTNSLSTTNEKLVAADSSLQKLASGHAMSLHQTMLSLEEAKLSFQYLEQIRNRLMSAYQDILREQI